MRELEFIPGAGGDGELIFAAVGDGDGERFRVSIDDALRGAVSVARDGAPEAPGDSGDSPADSGDSVAAAPVAAAPAAGDADGGDHAAAAPTPAASDGDADRRPRRLRPRQIQDRVRAGASIQDIMDETGMERRHVEPFAWPVLGERHRIAELGRASHPQRSDGPAPLTLAEVVATAFAARDLDPEDARWDARRDPAGQWIVSVAWSVGMSDNVAEWSFHPASAGESTSVSRNTLAAELVDPDYARATPFGARRDEAADEPEDDEVPEEFLRHPDDDTQRRRRRKTVMPSWEDVLLGVRPTDRK